MKLSFPNPFPNELCLQSNAGVIGFQAIQSLYQAWRISQISNGAKDFRVMEIGAGLGRTTFFAHQFGVKDYTIVDIPLTNAAQGYFFGRVLGEDAVSLYNETDTHDCIRILPASDIDQHHERYDLIINIDSLTEMDRTTAEMYWKFARSASPNILSINHEFNPVTVHDLYRDDPDV
jgi:putative sugar O-methyltransferase